MGQNSLSNAEVIQIAAAKRAGDAILRKATGKAWAEMPIDVDFALSSLGVRWQGVGVPFVYTVIARFRIIPSRQSVAGKMVKGPVRETVLLASEGKTLLMQPRADFLSAVTVPLDILALIDDTFRSTGAYETDGGAYIRDAIARVVGHTVKQQRAAEDVPARVKLLTYALLGSIANGALEAENVFPVSPVILEKLKTRAEAA